MGKWISVKKRLPPLDRVVLVCYRVYNGEPAYAFGGRVDDGEGWLWGIHHGYGGIRLGRDAAWNDVDADDDYQVTHWQTLPRAPFRPKGMAVGTLRIPPRPTAQI